MYIPLTDAPVDTPLELVKLLCPNLEDRLRKMGFTRKSRFRLAGEEVMLRPIRVKGEKGEAVISAGMAGKIVVHLDDGRKLPLVEMKPGETGHIEGRTGGGGMQSALNILGFNVDDRITYLRHLPPMDYVTFIETDNRRITLPEGMAAKIYGNCQGKMVQFCSASAGHPFAVTNILGGKTARKTAESFGIDIGKTLILEQVKQGQYLYVGNQKARYVITTNEGLRLFLEDYQAGKILVRKLSPDEQYR